MGGDSKLDGMALVTGFTTVTDQKQLPSTNPHERLRRDPSPLRHGRNLSITIDQEGFVSFAGVSLFNAGGTRIEAAGMASFRRLDFSMARPELARLQQAFMRVIIFAGFFLRESWAMLQVSQSRSKTWLSFIGGLSVTAFPKAIFKYS